MKLAEAVTLYAQYRKANGVLFEYGESRLRKFAEYCGDISLSELSPRSVVIFLDRAGTPGTYRTTHSTLRSFFDYLIARGHLSPFPMPPNRPCDESRFIPHVYTQAEVRALLQAVLNPDFAIEVMPRQTFHAFLLTLYATGAFLGEILSLRTKSLDLRRGYLTIISARSRRPRRIPLCRDLKLVLMRYQRFRQRTGCKSVYLFPGRTIKQPLQGACVRDLFRRLREYTGLRKGNDGRCDPRLLDLRNSFAVHRITMWIRSGADLNRMLPALAAYMGLDILDSTERYMRLTPERFRKTVSKLSPKKSRKKWRDDPELMQFLRAL